MWVRIKSQEGHFYGDILFIFFWGGGLENVKIIVENGEKTTLNICPDVRQSFLLCRYDVVELYDGVKEKNKLLGSFCDVQV